MVDGHAYTCCALSNLCAAQLSGRAGGFGRTMAAMRVNILRYGVFGVWRDAVGGGGGGDGRWWLVLGTGGGDGGDFGLCCCAAMGDVCRAAEARRRDIIYARVRPPNVGSISVFCRSSSAAAAAWCSRCCRSVGGRWCLCSAKLFSAARNVRKTCMNNTSPDERRKREAFQRRSYDGNYL